MKTLPRGRFKGREEKNKREQKLSSHSRAYSHITTTLSHSISKTEKQVKTEKNRRKQVGKNLDASIRGLIPTVPSGLINIHFPTRFCVTPVQVLLPVVCALLDSILIVCRGYMKIQWRHLKVSIFKAGLQDWQSCQQRCRCP